jgi:outer membrane protein assembly factor BamB
LDETTGSLVWGPVHVPGIYSFSAVAYDHGKLFVVNTEGLMESFDAATGTPGWSVQLTSTDYGTPTAVNGLVYMPTGAGVVAVEESSGRVVWTQDQAISPLGTAAAFTPGGVFAASGCDAYKIDPIGGTILWHDATSCVGAGTFTPVYAGGSLYVLDLWSSTGPLDEVLNPATGSQVGTFDASVSPAFSDTTGFYLLRGTLSATSLATGSTLWTFTGDGQLQTPPIVIDGTVVIASLSGTVYALDAATGSVLWTGSTGALSNAGNSTLGAGDGYLVVPAGSVLNGWRLIP